MHGLDLLRAFAITYVFMYHYGGIFGHPTWVNSISSFGWTGVDLFFVLSGYLISSQIFDGLIARNYFSWKSFFIKRCIRIIPAYLVVVGVYFCFPIVHEREALAPIWKYLSFTQNWGLDLSKHGTFSHAWSLCIEEQFYIGFPIVLLILLKTNSLKIGGWLLLLLFVFGFFARYLVWNWQVLAFEESDDFLLKWYEWIYYPSFARMDGLLLGIAVAAASRYQSTFFKSCTKHWRYFLFASILILVFGNFSFPDKYGIFYSVLIFPIVSFGYAFLLITAISPNAFLYRLKHPLIHQLANLSYALYLTHKISIHLTQSQFSKLGVAVDGNSMLLISIIVSLLIAWILNKLVEKPVMQFKKYLIA